jgi:hypothetical protein
MTIVRAKHLLVTVTAMLSLFVSAVSACACSHHEATKAVVESSCHGPSHEAPAAEQPNLLGSHFESDCNCYVRTPVPAVVAKKDDKKVVVDDQPAGDVKVSFAIAIQLDIVDEPETEFEPPQSNYQHALLASLPSRAPPRL